MKGFATQNIQRNYIYPLTFISNSAFPYSCVLPHDHLSCISPPLYPLKHPSPVIAYLSSRFPPFPPESHSSFPLPNSLNSFLSLTLPSLLGDACSCQLQWSDLANLEVTAAELELLDKGDVSRWCRIQGRTSPWLIGQGLCTFTFLAWQI